MHAYPPDLASFVAKHWEAVAHGLAQDSAARSDPSEPLLLPQALEQLISTCYQASLLRDEERLVTFRVMCCPPELFPADSGPPTGLHRLAFTHPRPFAEDELRRLSPSADFHRSLIGAQFGTDNSPEIWGIISSGPRWIKAAQGDRITCPPLPDRLVVSVTGPGRLTVARGLVTVAMLRGGRITCPASDVLESRWLQDTFASVREEVLSLLYLPFICPNRRYKTKPSYESTEPLRVTTVRATAVPRRCSYKKAKCCLAHYRLLLALCCLFVPRCDAAYDATLEGDRDRMLINSLVAALRRFVGIVGHNKINARPRSLPTSICELSRHHVS